MPRILILTEGKSNPTDAKTATGVLRYRPQDVVGVLDTTQAGRTCAELFGVGGNRPVVANLDDVSADSLLIGIAPSGGRLPDAWRATIRGAIERGMSIINGLHVFISDDPELGALARSRGVRIDDVRRPAPGLTVSKNAARHAGTFRVHTVGHDCNVGKMLVSLEIDRALREQGRRSKFLATGQTGIMISGEGVPIDAVVSDFVAGAIEEFVLANSDQEFLLIEGQGSLVHAMFSGVTLGLLHGCAPQAMVMCIDVSRTEIRHCQQPMPPLELVIDLYERMANLICPSRVIGVALNTSRVSESAAEEAMQRAAETTGLPVTDVVRYGVQPLVRAVIEAEADWRSRRSQQKPKP
jgi:uncharacterized NAD-dependent epimerase/dehydratase family protein